MTDRPSLSRPQEGRHTLSSINGVGPAVVLEAVRPRRLSCQEKLAEGLHGGDFDHAPHLRLRWRPPVPPHQQPARPAFLVVGSWRTAMSDDFTQSE